jgi:hypothetical protein
MRSMKAAGRLPLVATMGLFAWWPAVARAQLPAQGSDPVAAEALFEEGRRLVSEGKYGEACPKFAESEHLDASPSTLLNLASCLEKLGHTATAWATYKEAESAASAAHRQEYMDTAGRHARALAPALARLTIAVPQPIEGMQVRRDAVVVGPPEWGLAIPVDAGAHTVEASAPGYKAWTAKVDVPRDGAQSVLTVPPLEALSVEEKPAPPTAATAPATPAPVAPPPEPASNGRGQRTAGLVVAGAGVVGLGVSGVFALLAKGQYDDSLINCMESNHDVCTPQGVSQRDDARSMGNAATVAFGVGAAALVAGGVLWFTAPRGASHPSGAASFGLAPTPGGVVATGAW